MLFFQSIWRSKEVREATSTMKIKKIKKLKKKNEMLKDGRTGLGGGAWRSPEQSLEASLDGSWGHQWTTWELTREAAHAAYLGWLPLPQGEQLLWVPFRVQGVLWLGLGGDPHPHSEVHQLCSWSRNALSMLSTPAQRRGKIGHWNKRGSMLRAPGSPQYW